VAPVAERVSPGPEAEGLILGGWSEDKPQGANFRRHRQKRDTRTLSLGSCEHLRLVRALTWRNGRVAASPGCVAFPVIPRCSPPDLVRLWCGESSGRHGHEQSVRSVGRTAIRVFIGQRSVCELGAVLALLTPIISKF
jgi:hypothetical protein